MHVIERDNSGLPNKDFSTIMFSSYFLLLKALGKFRVFLIYTDILFWNFYIDSRSGAAEGGVSRGATDLPPSAYAPIAVAAKGSLGGYNFLRIRRKSDCGLFVRSRAIGAFSPRIRKTNPGRNVQITVSAQVL